MIELKDENGYKDNVYVDGVKLPKQCIEDVRISNKILSVRCLNDPRLSGPVFDFENVNYQIRKARHTPSTNNSVRSIRLFLDVKKLKNDKRNHSGISQ